MSSGLPTMRKWRQTRSNEGLGRGMISLDLCPEALRLGDT
jgi:hypothetical protein